MLARLFMFLMGWKVNNNVPEGADRCVMIASPHTSNWDFPIAKSAYSMLKIPLRFTIKDSWFRFPFNLLFGRMGGIPINRRPRKEGEERPSTVQAMAELFKKHDRISVMVTPEGTRSYREEWKSGFYHVATMAKVPIALGYLDYKNKVAGVGKIIHPSGDMAADMKIIMEFYKDITPEHPEKFSIDKRYL
ncbi:MAG: 1-acyl-sn-glycerol-3-phosphate acyltransferase [Chitinophagales bacterium]|jgi:1-acyl-sn-glycerol-3-phosphate acyltransferase